MGMVSPRCSACTISAAPAGRGQPGLHRLTRPTAAGRGSSRSGSGKPGWAVSADTSARASDSLPASCSRSSSRGARRSRTPVGLRRSGVGATVVVEQPHHVVHLRGRHLEQARWSRAPPGRAPRPAGCASSRPVPARASPAARRRSRCAGAPARTARSCSRPCADGGGSTAGDPARRAAACPRTSRSKPTRSRSPTASRHGVKRSQSPRFPLSVQAFHRGRSRVKHFVRSFTATSRSDLPQTVQAAEAVAADDQKRCRFASPSLSCCCSRCPRFRRRRRPPPRHRRWRSAARA